MAAMHAPQQPAWSYPVSPGPPPQRVGFGGWLRWRWLPLLATLIAAASFAGSLAAPWVSVEIFVLIDDVTNPVIESRTTETGLTRFGGWGYAYLAAVVPLILVTLAGVLVPTSWQRWVGLAGLGLAGAAFVPLAGAMVRAGRIGADTDDQAAELMVQLGPVAAQAEPIAIDNNQDPISVIYSTEGLVLAVAAVMVLGMTAAAIAFRGGGRWAAAAVATAATGIGLVAPWERLLLLSGDQVRRVPVRWPELGTPALAVAGGCVLLLAILWWSLLRRSPRGRLPVLIGSLLLAVALVAVLEMVELNPRDWMPAAEQAQYAMMDYRLQAGKQVLDVAPILLPVAVILAYAAARRRAAALRSTAGRG
jgi:hypothetical protein